VKAAARLQIQLVPSRWRRRLSMCSALFLGSAVGLLVHDLSLLPWRGLSGVIAGLGISGFAAVVFAQLAARNAKLGEQETLRLIFAAAGQVWIGPAQPLSDNFAVDAALPELRKMQRYLGLIWLSNSSAKQALIWPDSVSADEHRQLRVWLGIHARN
jgi:hypothetical protein